MVTKQELTDDIVSLTAPRDDIVDTDEVAALLTIAEREITAKVDGEPIFYPPSESENAQRALFWLTCLFVKVKTGEIEGARTAINDLDVRPLRAEAGDDAVYWLRNFRFYLAELQAETGSGKSGYGIRRIARIDRRYGPNNLY